MDIGEYIEHCTVKCERFAKEKLEINIQHEWMYRIIVAAGAIVITGFLSAAALCAGKNTNLDNGRITRPGAGEGALNLDIQAIDENSGQKQKIAVEVLPRQPTYEEAMNSFAGADSFVSDNIVADNESLQHVTRDLNLMTQIPEYGINVEWYSSDYDIIGYDGSVNTDSIGGTGTNVELTALMTCGSYKSEYRYQVHVEQPDLNGEERLWKSVKESVDAVLESEKHSDTVSLPQSVEGHSIRYEENSGNAVPAIIMAGVLAAAALIAGREQGKRKAVRLRNKQLQYDYTEIVSKLTLLTGAGMSVRRAWEKIALDYNNKMKDMPKEKYHAVYEEMMTTLRQMQSGMSENMAYAEFGRRCGIKEYRKLGTLLEQNVRKGTRGLSVLLEQESEEAFEQRKNLAKQLGEEAGTKLLLPMILMLAVVMVIVMVPAMMSFNF